MKPKTALIIRTLPFFMVLFVTCQTGLGQEWQPFRYDIGQPVLTDLWVDPVLGSDAHAGTVSNLPLRTLAEAWNRIPVDMTLGPAGFRILLAPGDYPESFLPGYLESRHGTATTPVIIQAREGRGTVRLHGYLNVFDCHYLYLLDLDVVTDPGYGGGGDVLHLELCSHVLVRGCLLKGFDGAVAQPQETLKANQCQHLYIEDSELYGAEQNVLDYVAVQYGHMINNKLHQASDWVMYVKGGSAYLRIEGNEIHDGGVGGFTAGQGTGFEYMQTPWLHYEAVDIKFVNNVIHHTGIAGMGVNGGYNILLAHNTLYRTGTNDHLLEIVHGSRSCDGNTSACASNRLAGGWGGVGIDGQFIPNRHVYVYNNLFYNPDNSFQGWQHFTIFGPMTPPVGSGVPAPSTCDTDLQIRGNLIWSGSPATPLGIEDPNQGCQPGNPYCNEVQLLADNTINQIEPQLVNAEAGDFRPVPRGTVYQAPCFPIPNFLSADRAQPPEAPAGAPGNVVPRGYNDTARWREQPVGAFTAGSSIRLIINAITEDTSRVSLLTESGYAYHLETSTNALSWQLLATTNTTGTTNDFIFPVGSGVRLYRASLEQIAVQ